VHGDVEDRDGVERALEAAFVSVSVQDEFGPVRRERDGEALVPEHGPDAARLALERVGDRRVVEERDAERGAFDLVRPRSSASTSAVVSAYAARISGSPKLIPPPSNPPMKPFAPTTPTETPFTVSTVDVRSSIVTPAAVSTSVISRSRSEW
jgi:hypothetical protein